MRVITPSISATHSTLGQNKVLGCFESTDTSVYVQYWWRKTSACKMSYEMVPLMRAPLPNMRTVSQNSVDLASENKKTAQMKG